MRGTLFVLFIAVSAVIAFSIARGISKGSNIDERQKYWAQQISGALNSGATVE